MTPLVIAIAAFIGVSALVGGVALVLRDKPTAKIEDRLDMMTSFNPSGAARNRAGKNTSVLSQPLDESKGFIETLLGRFADLNLLFEQADTSLTVPRLLIICSVFAVAGAALGAILEIHPALLLVLGAFMAVMPMFWLLFRRKRRLKAFAVQLPDALEMLSRALRAGQSLSAGCNTIAHEMSPPIGKEFGRMFEEQNLGISLEESLDGLANRIPNLDLKFFCTAVVLQRQTGGDLAEILDKIGHLIRERFQIWGQVQALTGEGRLSGIILLALPIVLFAVVYHLNPDYVSVLFTDEMGKKMLAGAIFLQIAGALIIRKIVNIKV
jgi:tight adherence protein B